MNNGSVCRSFLHRFEPCSYCGKDTSHHTRTFSWLLLMGFTVLESTAGLKRSMWSFIYHKGRGEDRWQLCVHMVKSRHWVLQRGHRPQACWICSWSQAVVRLQSARWLLQVLQFQGMMEGHEVRVTGDPPEGHGVL